MDYTKFYTPPQIAELLVKQIHVPVPVKVIDICCGSCNLLHAAQKKWRNVCLFGVDVNMCKQKDVKFTQADGRKFVLKNPVRFPLVLANPPFDKVPEKNKFKVLFNGMQSKSVTSRLEIEMLFANLRLLKEHGTLMIIMPSTFVESERNNSFRVFLAQNYFIQKIIHLPDDTFGASQIRSYALFIKNEEPKYRKTKMFNVVDNGDGYAISKLKSITFTAIKKGSWSVLPQKKCENTQILSIKRGNISSHYFSDNGIPILHTAKIQQIWKPSIRFVKKSKGNSNAVFAEAGDIVISRIGKSAGQWFKYEGEKILISDCLFVLKDADGKIATKLTGKKYSYQLKGVATRYITANDFNNWYLNI